MKFKYDEYLILTTLKMSQEKQSQLSELLINSPHRNLMMIHIDEFINSMNRFDLSIIGADMITEMKMLACNAIEMDYNKYGKELITRSSISMLESYVVFDKYIEFINAKNIRIALAPGCRDPCFHMFENGVYTCDLHFEDFDDELIYCLIEG